MSTEKEPGSAKLYCENRHVNERTILDKPRSTVHFRDMSGADTYLNELPNKCEITKEDREKLKNINQED